MTTTAVEFDPFSEVFFDDPYDVYRRLRDEAPVYFNEGYGFYALSRFADVMAGHKNWGGLSSAHGLDLWMMSKDPEIIRSYRSIITMDPPEHERFRALVSRVFTPRAIKAVEPMVREVIRLYISGIEDRDEFDAVEEFSAPFPVEVISRMLGVPAEDRQQIRHWLDLGLHREPGRMDPTPEGEQAMMESGMYFYNLVMEKRSRSDDDMLSRLTQVTVDRGDGTQTGLDDQEIAGFATLLGGAGAETVTKLVGNAFVLFAEHPDQWRKVCDNAGGIPAPLRKCSASWRRRRSRAGSRWRSWSSKAARSHPDIPFCSSPAQRHVIRGPTTTRTSSTSSALRASPPSAWATACTAVSAPRSPAWKAASPSRKWPCGGRTSKSTSPDSGACTWRT